MSLFGRRRKTELALGMASRQRVECPHLPHDSPCGAVHEGPCVLVHAGPCEAVQPICPGCHSVAIRVYVPSIANKVRSEGEVILLCSECEQRTFRYDADVICATCDWLVPHVNDTLAERFVDHGGVFVADPGTCPGCGHQGAVPPVSFPVRCPDCGSVGRVPQHVVDTTSGVSAVCANASCCFSVRIPASVWCPECHLNLRPLNKIAELIEEANGTDPMVWDNVKESPLERTARRVVALVDINARWSQRLTAEQRALIFDTEHLDALMSGDMPLEDWIRYQVEIRAIGHQLSQDGGVDLMRKVAYRASELSEIPAVRIIEVTWDGIGDWRG